MPVFYNVGYTGGCAGIILQHQKTALLVTNKVGAINMNVHSAGNIQPDHSRAVIGILQHQFGWDHTIIQDMPVMVNIMQKKIDGPNTLLNTTLDMLPFIPGNNTGNGIKRQNTINSLAVSINGKGNTHSIKLSFSRCCTVLEFLYL